MNVFHHMSNLRPQSHSRCTTSPLFTRNGFVVLLPHLANVCALKMAVNHFIQWHYDMGDCLRQIGVSWSSVHLAV